MPARTISQALMIAQCGRSRAVHRYPAAIPSAVDWSKRCIIGKAPSVPEIACKSASSGFCYRMERRRSFIPHTRRSSADSSAVLKGRRNTGVPDPTPPPSQNIPTR